MAVLISCQNLSKSFGARALFQGLSFGLFDGERTGLIGPNGAGKSTLLKILAGQDKPDEGKLAPRKGLRVGYLPQRDEFAGQAEGLSVRQVVAASLDGLGLQDYEVDLKLETGLSQAGFPDPEQAVSALSGGWRKRLAVLCAVLREPDLLLLDEPTNHLDLEGVLWLEKYLQGLKFSFLVITHDRRFLERVCNRVMELNKQYKDGYFSSAGNYSQFLEKREELLNSQQQREDSVRNIVRREIEWLRRGPKARQTKQQARIDRAGEYIEELDELKWRNAQGRSMDIDFSGSQRETKRLVELIKASKGMGGKPLFGPLDLLLRPGDKLGLLGENGSGKTTFLRLLAGELEPDSGSVKRADRLQVVRFDQQRAQLDLTVTLRQALAGAGEHVHYKGSPIHVAGWAGRFLFDKQQLDMPLSKFSGGEQSRVLIAQLMLKPADLLLLDEPTNDLDIQSLEVLEDSLLEFPGALVLVTHDRYLLDRVSKRILALDGKGHAGIFADYDQWEAWKNERPVKAEERPKPEPKEKAEAKPKAEAERAMSTKEREELRTMERSIAKAEEAVAKAEAALHDPAVSQDHVELIKRQEALDAARAKVEQLFARWAELEEKAKQA